MADLNKLEDPDRYYNWYHGYNKIKYPYYSWSKGNYKLMYNVYSSSTSGNISTIYYGEKFDFNKFDRNVVFSININVPNSVRKNGNDVALLVNIEKGPTDNIKMKNYNVNENQFTKNITGSFEKSYYIQLIRLISEEDVAMMNLDVMPGFKVSWNYNKDITPWPENSNYGTTREFVRYAE